MLTELFETYRPEGLIDAELIYHGGGAVPDSFSLIVHPKTLALDYAAQRIELTDLTGHVALTPTLAQLHDVAGRFSSGTFKLAGDMRLGEDKGLAVSFDVDAERIDAPTRAVVPPGVLSLIDKLAIQGPFTLDDATLLTWPDATQGPTRIFEGKLHLKGAQAELGVPVTELDADMDMRIVTFAEQPWPHTDVQVNAPRLRARDRLIERVSLNVVTGDYPWLINFTDLRGVCYGGTLVGHGQLRLGEQGALGFDLTLQETELEAFLNPLDVDEGSADAQAMDSTDLPTRNMGSGLLSARLSIRVPVDRPEFRQGRGAVTVRDARLYDRPLTLALLQAVNLSLPNESSFDRASARYLIDRDKVIFDDIRFEAPAFVISGSGSMAYPSTDLYLRMTTLNPTAPDLGPISTLVNTFKNELVGIEIRGTLAEPEARVVSFEGLFRSWNRVFGEKQAPLTQVVPIEKARP